MTTRYPLPAHHLGVEYPIAVEYIEPSTVLSLPLTPDEPRRYPISLRFDPATGRWLLASSYGFFGYLSAEQVEEFPDLTRLAGQLVEPVTWACVALVPSDKSTAAADAPAGTAASPAPATKPAPPSEELAIEVVVHLGLGPWQIPRNDQPEGTSLLEGGRGVMVHTGHGGDISDAQLHAFGTGQVIVVLSVIDSEVLCELDGKILGTLRRPPAELFELLAESGDTAVAARAYISHGKVAVDLPDFSQHPDAYPRFQEDNIPPLSPSGSASLFPALPHRAGKTSGPTGAAPPAAAAAAAKAATAARAAEVWEFSLPNPGADIPLPRGSRTVAMPSIPAEQGTSKDSNR